MRPEIEATVTVLYLSLDLVSENAHLQSRQTHVS